MAEVERIQGGRRRLQHIDDDPEEFPTTTEESAEEDEPEVSTTTMEASSEEAEEKARPSERLQLWRRERVFGIRVLTTTTVASAE